jgi:hypothetical protein
VVTICAFRIREDCCSLTKQRSPHLTHAGTLSLRNLGEGLLYTLRSEVAPGICGYGRRALEPTPLRVLIGGFVRRLFRQIIPEKQAHFYLQYPPYQICGATVSLYLGSYSL